MIKAIFSEVNDLRLSIVVGELKTNTSDVEKAHGIAKTSAKLLEDVRGREITYMLEQNGSILVSL